MRDSNGEDRVAEAHYREVSKHPNPLPEEERRAFRAYVAAKDKVRARLRPKWKRPLRTKEQRAAFEKHVAADAVLAPLKQKIAVGYLKFVIGYAGKKTKNAALIPDLISEGYIGLMVAIDKFDPGRGHRFLTYAAWWIDSYMREALNRTPGVHVPSHARKKYRKQRADEDKLIAQGKMTEYTVEEPVMSGTDPALLASPDNTEEAAKNSEFNALAHLRAAGLSRRARVILIYYYALRGGEPRTFRDLAKVLYQFDGVRITSERIRQVKERAIAQLKDYLRDVGVTTPSDVF